MELEQFIPVSNSEAWDFYIQNLKLREEIKELNIELSLTKNPIYCENCGSCGENGCCHPSTCKYLSSYQGEYDDLVKENERLKNLILNSEIPINDSFC